MQQQNANVRNWSPMKVGAGVGNYVVHHGKNNISAHRMCEDGVYSIFEFGANRAAAQQLADKLNAAGHVGQTVPGALVVASAAP